jgi:hypothetical protein
VNLIKLPYLLIMIPAAVSAQWIGDIRTESDWEYYYLNGYIDYNSYQLLREIAEGADISDTLEFISSTLGISPVELLEYYDIPGPSRLVDESSSPANSAGLWSGRLRLGSKIQDERREDFLSASARSDKAHVYLKLRNDGNGRLEPERRIVELNGNDYSITLGNFTNNIGCGLVLGRFDYRPVSFDSDEGELDQFLFPDNSYYNGVKAELFENHTIVYSIKKYNDVYKNTFGSMLSAKLPWAKIGIAGSAARLSSNEGARTLGAGSVFIDLYEYDTKAEVAYGESGPGAAVQVSRPDYLLRGWYYDESYINLQSSGFAHPDYLPYTDDYSELSFRQAQRGETGFYARKRIRLKKVDLRGAVEFWNNPRNDLINYNNFIQSRLFISENVETLLGYVLDYKNGINRNKIESGLRIIRDFEFDMRVLTSFENRSIAKDDSRFYILGSIPLTTRVALAGRLRWRFDGEFDYFIEERAVLNERLYLKATYRWKEDSGKELGSLYAFLENRF